MVLRGSCSAVFSLIVKSLVFLFLMIISFLIYITEPCPWRAIPHYLLYCADDWAAVEGDGWFRWDQIQSPLPHQHSTHPQATTCPGLWASTFVFCLPLFFCLCPHNRVFTCNVHVTELYAPSSTVIMSDSGMLGVCIIIQCRLKCKEKGGHWL